MTLISFFRIIAQKWKWLILFPFLISFTVFFLTRTQEREFETKATIYTGLASGYSITDDGEKKTDLLAINNSFDNLLITIKSRETLEEVGLKLLAQHLLLNQPSADIMGESAFYKFNKLIPEEIREMLIVPGSFEKTLKKLMSIKESSSKNSVRYILNVKGAYYNPDYILAALISNRKASSDMVELSLKTNDPGVTLNMLNFLIETFSSRFKSIKGSETNNVVKYFEEQLKMSFSSLQSSENKLRDFGIENKIINYNEQSKFVAESKEDLSTEYYKEKMRFEGASSALKRIEEKNANYSDVLKTNEELIKIRQKISQLNINIANAKAYKMNTNQIHNMENELDLLKEDMKDKAREYYNYNNNIEWVPQEDLLNEWLNKVVELEESRGRLVVFENRIKQYDGIYSQFAPLGSTITRMDREININEKEYLTILHGLSLAKLRQQNLEMSNNLKTVDSPFFPIAPLPSKRGLLIVLAFFAGFVLLLTFYIAAELSNSSVRIPERVVSQIGLPLLSALPDLEMNTNKIININEMNNALVQRIINSIFIELKKKNSKAERHVITILSTKNGEGKTYISQLIASKLAQIKNDVILLNPETSSKHALKSFQKFSLDLQVKEYKVIDKLVDADSITDLIEVNNNKPLEQGKHSFVIIELPSLNKYPIPVEILEKSDISILIVHANKSWSASDIRILNEFEMVKQNQTKVILNRVVPDLLEGIYGEIPKNRSILRKKLKIIFGGQKY
jgi:succinoglycan biosynthesis transport protein ExoP